MNADEMLFLFDSYRSDTVLCTRSFVSCSLLASVAVKFHDIYVQHGTKVIFVIFMSLGRTREFAYVKPVSCYKHEEEVIIRPYRRFTIASIKASNEFGATMVVLRPNYT